MRLFLMMLEEVVVDIIESDGKGGWGQANVEFGKGGWDRTEGKGGW